MIYKCEYCKTYTAHSEGMRMECVNCGAAIPGATYTDRFIVPKGSDINPINLAPGLNYIEYTPTRTWKVERLLRAFGGD